MAENHQRIAEINSHLSQIIVNNDKRLSSLDSEIAQVKLHLKYKEILAPVFGQVFNLKTFSGFVTSAADKKTVLKIVPDDHLVAEVFVTNQEIGLLVPQMKADVRIDTFPFSDFGDIKGEVVSIGSDALPPDPIHNYYRFPVRVKLEQQSLTVDERSFQLQSGMSVTVNIRVREKRTVMSVLFKTIMEKFDSLKEVR